MGTKAGRIFILGLSWVVMGWGMVAIAQAPDTLWTRRYGGNNVEVAYSVQQTQDGGYIIAGYTRSFGAGGMDVYLVKTDSRGDTVWTHRYGGNTDQEAYSVDQTTDGGYVFVGYTYVDGTYPQWAGYARYLVKTDSIGSIVWERIYAGGEWYDPDSWGFCVQQTTSGGYIIAGQVSDTYSPTRYPTLTLANSLGNVIWGIGLFGGISGYDVPAKSVQQTSDEGYIVTGQGDGLCIEKIGNSPWMYRHEPGYSEGRSVDQTVDGGYIAAGYYWSMSSGEKDFFLVKVDSMGDTLWTKTYGGSGAQEACSVQETTDGGYIMAGSGGGFLLIKVNSNGDTLWTGSYGGSVAYSVQQTSDEGYIIAGSGYGDFFLVKTEPDPLFNVPNHSFVNLPARYSLGKPYPNPFNMSTKISYEVPVRGRAKVNIYDVLGRQVATVADGVVSPGSYSVGWEAGDLPSGIYFVRMEAREFVQTRKVVLLK